VQIVQALWRSKNFIQDQKKIAFIKRTSIEIKKPLALQKRNQKIDKTE